MFNNTENNNVLVPVPEPLPELVPEQVPVLVPVDNRSKSTNKLRLAIKYQSIEIEPDDLEKIYAVLFCLLNDNGLVRQSRNFVS